MPTEKFSFILKGYFPFNVKVVKHEQMFEHTKLRDGMNKLYFNQCDGVQASMKERIKI